MDMFQDDKLRLSLVQYDIVWEDKQKNLEYLHNILESLSDKTDIIVLPEMFTTGFSMNSQNLAEPNDGKTITQIKQWAKKYNIAICRSFIASEKNIFNNRAFVCYS